MSKFRNIKGLWLDQKGTCVDDDDHYYEAGEGEETKGKYDDDVNNFSTGLTEGIKRDRSCTDILCLVIFWAFVGSMVFLTSYGLKNGQYDRLMAPLDKDNNFCGFPNPDGADMTGYPKLILTSYVSSNPIDILKSGVCVKTCPSKADAAEGSTFEWKKGVNCNGGSDEQCDIHSKYPTLNNPLDICIPVNTDAFTDEEKIGFKAMVDYFKNTAAGQVLNDMYLSSTSMYISFVTALVWSIVYIYILSLFAETLAWCCVCLIQLGLIGATCAGYMGWDDAKKQLKNQQDLAGYAGMSEVEQKAFDKENSQVGQMMALMIVAGLLTFLFACAVICGRKSLQTAIDVIDASADYIAHNKRVILVPNLHFLLNIIVVIVWLFGFAAVMSLNEIKASSVIPQKKDVNFKEKKYFYAAMYMIFGFFWITAFVEYLSRFIIIVGATTYYFNNHRDRQDEEASAEICYGFTCAYWYHPGSIAMGSFIIAVVRFIKFIFYHLAKQAVKRSGDNPMVKAIAACGMCCLNCIEKICDYLNEAAFCYMAVTGDHFFKAAWNGFLLNMKHGLAFAFANTIAKVFMFIGKVGITVTNCFTLYAIMKYVRGDTEEVSSIWGPVIVVGIVSYIAASLFLSLFEEAVMALLTCVCVDMDMNNGEPVYGPATFHDSYNKIKEDGEKANDMS